MHHRNTLPLAAIACLALGSISMAADPQPNVDLYGDPLPPRAVSRLGTVRFRQQGALIGITYSEDGASLVGFSTDAVYIWDSHGGRLVRTLPVSEHRVQSVAIASDRCRAITFGFHIDEAAREVSFTLKAWDLAGERELTTVQMPDAKHAACMALNADGTLAAIADEHGTVHLFEVATGTELLTHRIDRRRITSIAFSPHDERLLFAAGRKLFIWNWIDGDVPQPLGDQNTTAWTSQWSHDGTLIAVDNRGADGVLLLDGTSGRPVDELAHSPDSHAIRIVAFSPNDRLLATCDQRMHSVTLWDLESRKSKWSHGHDSWRITHIAFSPDGRRLAAASQFPAQVHCWDVETGRSLTPAQAGHQAAAHCIAFLPKARTIATAGDDGTLRFWDVASGRQLRMCVHQSEPKADDWATPWIRALDVSRDGRLAATSGQDNTVRIWDTISCEQLHQVTGHGRQGDRRALRFSLDGTRLASWGDDMWLYHWDTQTGEHVARYPISLSGLEVPGDDGESRPLVGSHWKSQLRQGAFSMDASQLVLRYDPQFFYLFDVANGKEIKRITAADFRCSSFAISPGKDRLLAGSFARLRQQHLSDGVPFSQPENEFEARLLSFPSGELNHIWKLHGTWASAVAFGPRGEHFAVATGHVGAPIRVYRTAGAELVAELGGFDGIPLALAFSQSGELLASSMSDTTVLVWKLP